MIQVVFNPDVSKEALTVADKIRTEFVVDIQGTVKQRDEKQVNKNIASGEIEVYAEHIEILSKAKTPPFQVSDDNINEDTRLKYRYIDLRRPKLQNILKTRSVINAVRDFLAEDMDIETPVLAKSTPECRDYLVPSRVQVNLPASVSQIYKQLLMLRA